MAKCVPNVVGMTILQEYILNSLQNFNNQNNTSIHDIEVEVQITEVEEDIHHVGTRPADRYFATLHTSSTGRHFHHIKFQIDTAATCNTISESTIQHNFSDAQISKSPYLLYPYGNSKPIKPIDQVSLLCERKKRYHNLTFQILPDVVMQEKPALLSGKDCIQMGLVNIYEHGQKLCDIFKI